jgi:hypothetical protein
VDVNHIIGTTGKHEPGRSVYLNGCILIILSIINIITKKIDVLYKLWAAAGMVSFALKADGEIYQTGAR